MQNCADAAYHGQRGSAEAGPLPHSPMAKTHASTHQPAGEMMDKLFKCAEGLNRRFPDGNDPFEIIEPLSPNG